MAVPAHQKSPTVMVGLSTFRSERRYSLGAAARFSFFISRDFRRAALRGCRMPFEAALSSLLIARTTSAFVSSAAAVMPRSALRTYVLTADLIDRFRTRRRSAARIIFSAERVFATNRLLLIAAAPVAAARARSAPADVWRAASSIVFSDFPASIPERAPPRRIETDWGRGFYRCQSVRVS